MSTRVNEFGQPIGLAVAPVPVRQYPGECALVGTSITVRPLQREDAAQLFEATCTAAPERWTYMVSGPFASVDELAAMLDGMLTTPDMRPMALITPSGRIVGTATFMRIDPRQGTAEVGTIMFSPELARTRAATESMALMADHVFSDLGYRRYEWKCDSLNAPSRAAAIRLGFTFEGVWRNALTYKGRNRDTAWYAMTDDDWRVLKPCYDRWLTETEADRPQKSSLSELTRDALSSPM